MGATQMGGMSPGPQHAAGPALDGPYNQPNPLFGTGKAFAPPRRFLLSAMVDF